MTLYLHKFPAIPEETLRAATSMYGKGNIYLRLGDSLDRLIAGLNWPENQPGPAEDRIFDATIRYMLLTVVQYVEELSNMQVREALHSRVDLKYALHMPMVNPGFDPNSLCSFRKQLFDEPASQKNFQVLLERLVQFGMFKPDQPLPLDADRLLLAVCTLNQFEEVIEAMYRALEALAVINPEWLRQIMLPYWYDRYDRRRRMPKYPFSDEKWAGRSAQIAVDIQYLLEAIDKSLDTRLGSREEIQAIRHIWKEQFFITTQGNDRQQIYRWGPTRCATCRPASALKEV